MVHARWIMVHCKWDQNKWYIFDEWDSSKWHLSDLLDLGEWYLSDISGVANGCMNIDRCLKSEATRARRGSAGSSEGSEWKADTGHRGSSLPIRWHWSEVLGVNFAVFNFWVTVFSFIILVHSYFVIHHFNKEFSESEFTIVGR